MSSENTSTIVLIGPICAGKSTIAKLLAKELERPRYEMDELRWEYFEKTDYSKEAARQIFEQEGNLGVLNYSKPFEAEMVELVLRDHPGGIIDFGAGHSVYEDEQFFGRVEAALEPLNHVILVLPTQDDDESVRILNERFKALLESEGIEPNEEFLALNEHFVRHPSNKRLAKKIVYTDGKSPEESAQELLEWINH